jgi:hypothetical protein
MNYLSMVIEMTHIFLNCSLPTYAVRSILSDTFDFDLLIVPVHLTYEEHQRPPNSLFPLHTEHLDYQDSML